MLGNHLFNLEAAKYFELAQVYDTVKAKNTISQVKETLKLKTSSDSCAPIINKAIQTATYTRDITNGVLNNALNTNTGASNTSIQNVANVDVVVFYNTKDVAMKGGLYAY